LGWDFGLFFIFYFLFFGKKVRWDEKWCYIELSGALWGFVQFTMEIINDEVRKMTRWHAKRGYFSEERNKRRKNNNHQKCKKRDIFGLL